MSIAKNYAVVLSILLLFVGTGLMLVAHELIHGGICENVKHGTPRYSFNPLRFTATTDCDNAKVQNDDYDSYNEILGYPLSVILSCALLWNVFEKFIGVLEEAEKERGEIDG